MMNTLVIRPFGAPVAPLPGVFDILSMPATVLALMKPVWPHAAPGIGATDGFVVVYAFMPRTGNIKVCGHCADSIRSIANLRQAAGAPPFRIVVMAGPDDSDLAELAAALKLDPARDFLCADAELEAFQGMALVDGVPVYNTAKHLYEFPQSFRNDGKLLHDGDLMHGLFIVDKSGFPISCDRGFMAYDDTEEILKEIRLAEDTPAGLGRYQTHLKNAQPATPQEKTVVQREELNLQRQQLRYEEFHKAVK